ncbi:MAG: hypothetical protein Q8K89_09155, partial [Actinomycetota bacterium]|nr:hypothetical protein [Actinomycetota bacterium]
ACPSSSTFQLTRSSTQRRASQASARIGVEGQVPCKTALSPQIASEQRVLLGTKVGRNTPVHVAELIRDIARLGHQLTDRQVATIRSNLTEARMK